MLDRARFKCLLCGRRAGKTDVAIKDLAHGMMATPKSANLYVALTIGSALRIFWEPFKELNERHGWGFKLDASKNIIRHPNGSWLQVAGGDTAKDLEKPRGVPWKRVRIDECGSWKPAQLQYFVEQVLEPSFMDHDGDLWLMGTPQRQAYGFFYEVTTGKQLGWGRHHWTAKNNPHVDWETFVHAPADAPRPGLLARRGWTEENPIFKREYLAIWSVDPSELVYAFDRDRNVVDTLPEHRHGWDYVVGIDYGVNNACAYSVIASPRHVGTTIYTVKSFRKSGLAPSEFADVVNDVLQEYQPWKAVGDMSGLGKGFWKEYSVRYSKGWPIQPANKLDRRGTLEIASDMLRTGRKKVLREGNDDLIQEWSTLQWDEDRENTAEGQDNDVSDADMYGSKECPAFLQLANEPPPPTGEPKWAHDDEDDEHEEQERSYLWAPEE